MTLSVAQEPVALALPIDTSVLSKDLESQVLTNKDTAKVYHGRSWKFLPASFGRMHGGPQRNRLDLSEGGGAKGGCCILGIIMAIVGACMWGICNDRCC